MTKVKICGLRREEDIRIVNKYLPDYIGFVFADSKRKVTREEAHRLKSQLDERILSVGVFVNAPIEEIAALVKAKIINFIQLHGDEEENYMNALRCMIKEAVPIIKALRAVDTANIEIGRKLPADYFLLDTYSAEHYGGIGKTFDWNIVPGDFGKFYLAGGLNSGNVATAIEMLHPYCVDISSGVETEGYKDEKKVMEFIAAVRAAGRTE
ncbi:MAG: trpF [Herbinix sp.]|jgi:phosphoribosylanthranilate isomerase|nr:trpF [Herbinix sp.]MDF2871269.1 trpF [Anaerocolumna sp.]